MNMLRKIARRFIKVPIYDGYAYAPANKLCKWMYPPNNYKQDYHFEGIVTTRRGNLVAIDTTNWVGWNIFVFGEYSPVLSHLFHILVKPGATAFDVGANIGDTSADLCSAVGVNGQVFAFEPFPLANEKLQDVRRLNGLGNLHIREFALSNVGGVMDLHCPKPGTGDLSGVGRTGLTGMSSLARPGEKYMEGVEFETLKVEVKTIDSVVDEEKIKSIEFIKIDVEGFDCNVIEGGLESINKFRPYIIFEYDPVWMSRSGKSFEDARKMLNGYEFYKLGSKLAQPLTIIENQSEVTSGDVLAVPKT